MYKEITDKCLIVFNSYKELNLDKAQEIFQESFQKKYNKEVDLKVVQLQEPAGIRGNLPGYLSAYKRLSKKLTEKEIMSFDTIIFIHDAGLATRLFPLTYEYNSPLKSTVRFPGGTAIELLFNCVAKNVPLLKESVIILPVDQYFNYESVDIKGLSKSLKNHTFSMFVTPISIKRALGSLGTVRLGKNNKIESFYEKTKDENLIPRYSKELTLANTFQLITTKDSLNKMQKAIDLFASKPENLNFVKKLDNTEWSFNKLVCESLTLKNEQLSDVQTAMKECLNQYNITVGGVVAQGYWEDWSSTIISYINIVHKLAKETEKPIYNNYFIRSKKIVPSGILKSCIFIDCDTVDLFGDFENCIFINCGWIRVMSSQKTNNALFYSLRELNFLRRNMSDYVYSRFMSGRRHIEFECETNVNLQDLWKSMKKISDDWMKYHETVQASKTEK